MNAGPLDRNSNLSRRRLLAGTVAATLAGTFAQVGRAAADTYPSKLIRVVLPGPAGGVIDIAIRALSDALSADLGQQIVVDPRPGGNGLMAGQLVVASPRDGYTLELTVSGQLAFPFLMKVPFDVVEDFSPIAMVGVATSLFCVSNDLPVKDLAGFVDYARNHAGAMNYLNPGNGTPAQLIIEQIKISKGIDIASVPYKGLPPGVQDLIGRRIQAGVVSAPIILQHVKSGSVKAIAVVGNNRLQVLADVSTMTEQGFGDFEVQSALPLFGPKGLPLAIVERLNLAFRNALRDPQVRERLASVYIEPLPMTVKEVEAWVVAQHSRLGKLIAQTGIKADGSD